MLYTHNSRDFRDICNKHYGRKVIYTDAEAITAENVAEELGNALAIHAWNREEIEYLDRYYRGDQPILYRDKQVRPEINNRIVENHAYEIVEFKTAQRFGEPVQYVRRGTDVDDSKSEAIKQLNNYMLSEDKGACDIELGRWQSICGTSYRFIYLDKTKEPYDEAPYGIEALNPAYCGVVYSSKDGKKPMFDFMKRRTASGKWIYIVHTKTERFEISGKEVINRGVNGFLDLPIVEYPNNERRLSDIELVLTMLDAMNKEQSDRVNDTEQFVQALMLFKNCAIDEDTFLRMIKLGAVTVQDTADGKQSDVKLLTSALSQEGTQVSKDDIYDNILQVVGMPSREQNTGGDTGQAVYLRNGWDFAEQRAEITEPLFHKSERRFLKLVLSTLETYREFDLKLSDIEIKVTRNKMDNLTVKVNALSLLLSAGIDYQVAIKTVGLWSDPEEVYLKSRQRLQDTYESENEPVSNAPIPNSEQGASE